MNPTDKPLTISQIKACAYVMSDVEYQLTFGQKQFNKFASERKILRSCGEDLLFIAWPDGTSIIDHVVAEELPYTPNRLLQLYIDCLFFDRNQMRGAPICNR